MKKRNWLIEFRKEKGLSLIDVAKKADVTQQFYYYIENGERRPSPEVAQKIADILGFNWTIFFEKKQ
ncbi:MAG: helix-turn-helix transcriptional regulator [Bacilli bacterium]|nr:helix-turn-helix transcriptional regulator [Bacilli bacterium]